MESAVSRSASITVSTSIPAARKSFTHSTSFFSMHFSKEDASNLSPLSIRAFLSFEVQASILSMYSVNTLVVMRKTTRSFQVMLNTFSFSSYLIFQGRKVMMQAVTHT